MYDIFDMGGGGSLGDPPWVSLESINARVLCTFGGGGGGLIQWYMAHGTAASVEQEFTG